MTSKPYAVRWRDDRGEQQEHLFAFRDAAEHWARGQTARDGRPYWVEDRFPAATERRAQAEAVVSRLTQGLPRRRS